MDGDRQSSLREIREQKGLTIEEVSLRLNYTVKKFHEVENNPSDLSISAAHALARYYRLTIDDIDFLRV